MTTPVGARLLGVLRQAFPFLVLAMVVGAANLAVVWYSSRERARRPQFSEAYDTLTTRRAGRSSRLRVDATRALADRPLAGSRPTAAASTAASETAGTTPQCPAASAPGEAKGPALEAGRGTWLSAAARQDAEASGKVADLVARCSAAIADGDGRGVLAALKELTSPDPPGYSSAIDLWGLILRDLSGENHLGIDYRAMYRIFSSPKALPLLKRALADDEATPEVRKLALERAAVLDDGSVLPLLAQRLGLEKDPQVQRDMLCILADRGEPEGIHALAEALTMRSASAELRRTIVESLWDSDAPEVGAALRAALEGDADPAVREAAAWAIILREPPVDGYLVSTVAHAADALPADLRAGDAGLRRGDIVVSINGVDVTSPLTIHEEAKKLEAGAPGRLVVYRDGKRVEVGVKTDQLDLRGQLVRAAR
ncbi:MAG: HEAT repeat domain-containing protein [Planctomycetes bacterium]|nr:HEAT repeat domain-containing protein [Planctomycetota bacterium]